MATIKASHDKHGILWQKWSGTITMQDLLDQAETQIDPLNDSPIQRAVSDFRESTMTFSPAEVWDLVDKFLSNPARREGWRWAVLVEVPDHVGLATLFQHRGKDISMKVGVFSTESAAVEWLLAPDPPDA